ncbi:MAG: hypothetical protein QM808_09345 [Steroidobacteraceae bacterium]
MKRNAFLTTSCAIALTGIAITTHADMIDPALVKKGDTGLSTPYGETAAELANKKVMFDWIYMNMVERKPREAFEKYVSKDYCNHGHLSTGGQRECAGYWETYERWVKNYSTPLKPGEKIEMPNLASVNGEMITMFGAGVDIFRVKDGKITDHWDASPPAEATIKAHHPDFAKWVMGDRKDKPPMLAGATPGGIIVDRKVMTAVDVGPLTPYGETKAEQAAKRIVFSWNYVAMVLGKPKDAADKYLADNFCDHSHMVTAGKKDCATRAELLAGPNGQRQPAKLGERLEIPTMGSVNGEIVTMYGAGIDIFKVVNGKITDHWDASPPREVTIEAHSPAVVDHMINVINGDAKPGSPPPGGGAPVSQSK